MRIEVAKHERMAQSGSSLMRLIQNNELPTLDLLVRESIQNSSDAAKTDAESVKVDYNIKQFVPENVNRHFEGIAESLNRKSKEVGSNLLEIRDSNTTGLKGPLTYDEAVDNNFGNLINLIYEISRPQQKEGAGGSWGLGKTVYFRLGIGLVVYYSRIEKEKGEYESRLAACLIEDEKSEGAMLQMNAKGPKRGIAWWGEKEKLSEEQDMYSSTIPVTDESQIKEILADLNIQEFDGNETGTAIIIPYIEEDKLVKNARASASGEHWWTATMKDYLNVAVQRWYAPRIMNRSYPFNLPLVVSVNSKEIRPQEMLPVFRAIQDLYSMSSFSKQKPDSPLLLKDIYEEEIRLRTVFEKKTLAGVIVFTKLSQKELLMTSPANNSSPLSHTNAAYQDEKDLNPPLICYLRKPGMIVNYDAGGSWVKNINSTRKDEYLIGIFIPNSENQLLPEYKDYSLEEYLRKSEKADHTSWSDWTIEDKNPQIVNKIKGQIGKKINNIFKDNTNKKLERKNASIGKAVAEILLPPENFGSQSIRPTKKPGGRKTGSADPRNKSNLKLSENPIFNNGNITLPFTIVLGSKVQKTQVSLKIVSEGGDIEANKWEEEDIIGSDFPLRMFECKLESAKVGNDAAENDFPQVLNTNTEKIEFDSFTIDALITKRFDVPYGVEITNKEENIITINGEITFEPQQANIQGSLTSKDSAGESK